MEAQLGLIGGTMGLLTGFSILSGIEIIFYLLRLLWFALLILIWFSSGSSCLSRSQEPWLCLRSTRESFDKDRLEMAKTVDHCIYVHIALSCLFCFTGREHSSKNIYLFSVPVFTMLSYILGVQLWWMQVDTVVISRWKWLKISVASDYSSLYFRASI